VGERREHDLSSIKDNLSKVLERIARAAERSGQTPESIKLVAVGKTIGPEKIIEAIDAGVTDIGENRIQEALAKRPLIQRDVKWHMVGHLQRNKVKQALDFFDLIHSVDSIRLLDAIEKRAEKDDRVVDILTQVNTSGEATKYGLKPEEVINFVEYAVSCEHTRVRGLMTIGPFVEDAQLARPSFQQLRDLRDQIIKLNLPRIEMKYLSMGMTSDFEVAIEEGANMVRIGTAIYGPRT